MKKVKSNKKWKLKKSKINKSGDNIKFSKILFIIIYIFVLPAMIIYIIKHRKNILQKEKTEKFKSIFSSEEMYFKGEKILKSKVIEDFLANVTDKYKNDKKEERELFNKYYYLPEYQEDIKIQNIIKQNLLDFISERKKKTINKINTIFIDRTNPFGNNVPCINNAIFYCEILGCNQIILRNRGIKRRWLIQNPVYIEKLNITIMLGTKVNCDDENTLCFYQTWDLLYPRIVFPQIKTQYIKDEVLRNLPNVTIDPNDLYIHIRGGDIFHFLPLKTYSQPPLCFYEKVINSNKFKNIYIIAADQRNPVLSALINKYPNIKFQSNNLEYDISLLAHAYNIVLSISSFCISAIKFNGNLKNVYEFDIYHLGEMFIHLHHNIYKYDKKYFIYSMKPSEKYKSKMFSWRKSSKQRILMIEDNCPNDFIIIKPN